MRKNVSAKDIKKEPDFNTKEKHPWYFFMARFAVNKYGRFSKRHFFFSLFALTAFAFILICIIFPDRFNNGLGAFIISANVAFGLSYHMNERAAELRVQRINEE